MAIRPPDHHPYFPRPEIALRKLSTFVDRITGLAHPKIPASRLDRVKSAFRRRLDDAVEDVFSRACLNGDLETAAELLQVLEYMHERRRQLYGRERRISDALIVRARRELEWRRQSRPGGARPSNGTGAD